MWAADPTAPAAICTTLPEAFVLAARTWPSRSCLTVWSSSSDEILEHVTFADFLSRATSVRQQLRESFGLVGGRSVCVLSVPTAEYFALAAGILLNGCTIVNGNYKLAADRLAAAVEQTGAKLIVHSADNASLCDEAARASEGFARLRRATLLAATLRGEAAESDTGARADANDCFDASAVATAAEVDALVRSVTTNGGVTQPDSVAAVMFTSGSTGTPKAVQLTHGGLLWACRAKLATHGDALAGIADDDAPAGTLSFLPTYHVMGFTNNWLFNVTAGWPTLVHRETLTTPLCIELLRAAVATLRPSIVDTVPHLLESLALQADDDPTAAEKFVLDASGRSPLRLVLYGGCALSSSAYARLEALGVPLASQYGQTEVGGMSMLGGVGTHGKMRPVSGIRVELRPAGEEDAEEGAGAASGVASTDGEVEVGELVLLGMQSATIGYIGRAPPDPPATQVHCTGDLFRKSVDADGSSWYEPVCRKDDLIVHTTGEMTNPLPLEDALLGELRHNGAARVVVIGQRRPLTVLVVERSSPFQPGTAAAEPLLAVGCAVLDAALALANARVPSYSHVRASRVVIVPSGGLPLSNKGSILRHMVEREHRAAMDTMDEALLSGGKPLPSSPGDEAGSGGGGGGGKGSGKGSVEDPSDSLSRAAYSGGARRSPEHTCHAHLCALCMLGIVLHHITFMGAHVKGPGAWVASAFALIALPGFVFAAGWLDYTHPCTTRREVLRKLGMNVLVLVIMYLFHSLRATAWLVVNLLVYRLLALPLQLSPSSQRIARGLAVVSVLALVVHAFTAGAPWPLSHPDGYLDLLLGAPCGLTHDGMEKWQCAFTGKQLLLNWPLYLAMPMAMPATSLTTLPTGIATTVTLLGRRVALTKAALIRGVAALVLLLCTAIAARLLVVRPELSGTLDGELRSLKQARFDGFDDAILWTPAGVDAAAYMHTRLNALLARTLLTVLALWALCHLMPSTPTIFAQLGDCALVCLIVHDLVCDHLSSFVTVRVTCPLENLVSYLEAVGSVGSALHKMAAAAALILAALALQVATSFYVGSTSRRIAMPGGIGEQNVSSVAAVSIEAAPPAKQPTAVVAAIAASMNWSSRRELGYLCLNLALATLTVALLAAPKVLKSWLSAPKGKVGQLEAEGPPTGTSTAQPTESTKLLHDRQC